MSLRSVSDEAYDRRLYKARMRLFGSIANTYGYAAMGAALAGPLLQGDTGTVWHVAAFVFGLSAHAAALILAPIGDRDDRLQ